MSERTQVPIEGYFFPKTVRQYSDDGLKWFPHLQDTYEGYEGLNPNEDYKHPIIKALRDGGKIEAVKMGDDWTDDHEICFNIDITVDGKKYGMSFWWITREFYRTCIRAEFLHEESLERVRGHIMSSDDKYSEDFPAKFL